MTQEAELFAQQLATQQALVAAQEAALAASAAQQQEALQAQKVRFWTHSPALPLRSATSLLYARCLPLSPTKLPARPSMLHPHLHSLTCSLLSCRLALRC